MPSYINSVLHQRAERDKHMIVNPLNWLALCGLFWLEEGENSFGSGPSNRIVLPESLPARAGVFTLMEKNVYLTQYFEGLTINGKRHEVRALLSDRDGNPDTIAVGSISLRILQRGDRFLVRAWDRDSQAVKDFKGLKYYPVKPEYCVTASYTAYDPPMQRKTFDVIGSERVSEFPGWVKFTLDGNPYRLEAEDSDDELLLNFTDLTKLDDTYPGGRYITVPKPTSSEITLDFNLAINWPCAYTSFATCPLPPSENRLGVRIEAGELRYHD
jgi:uncharacterized protein (DUF1684 family)